MLDELAEVIAKLREIERQAFNAFLEVPSNSVAYSRLRHISTVAKYARMKLEGVNVCALDSVVPERDGASKAADN